MLDDDWFLHKKIDRLVEGVKEGPIVPQSKKRNNKKKLTVFIVCFTLIIVFVGSGFLSGVFTFSEDNGQIPTGKNNQPETEPLKPEIPIITPASEVRSYGNYTEKTTFKIGEIVNIYYEYLNVSHENIVDTYHTIIIRNKDTGLTQYSDTFDSEKNTSELEDWYLSFEFPTFTWPPGDYLVEVGFLDEITFMTAISETNFTLIE